MILNILLLLFAFAEIHGGTKYYNDFDSNFHVSTEERKAVKPHLLPYDHPIREKLDLIFYRSRATQDMNSLVEAGFQIHSKKSRSFIVVASHPDVPGYLFKLHLDDELRQKRHKPGWWWFCQRCIGAKAIRKVIEKKKYDLVRAPQKYIYPLPLYPETPNHPGYQRKNVILVVEKFDLLNDQENWDKWHQDGMTTKHLDQIYGVLSRCGGDSMRPDNIPFDTEGRICFIDTEYPGKSPRWEVTRDYLPPNLRDYWIQLTGL